jgi:hypothetical protein
MGRLIQVPRAPACPSHLTVKAGDALLFTAVGVRVRSGADIVTIVGPFTPGVIGDDGQVLSPAGPPNAVMVVARQAGQAAIDVISGDPWHATQTTSLSLTVEA